MEQVKQVLNASRFWQAVTALCLWCSAQWRSSGVVRWFLNPRGWGRAASESSIFFKVGVCLRRALCWLYERLGLERVFSGSVFGRTWLWCVLPVALAPVLPTMAVLGLSAVGFCTLLLALARSRERQLDWAPINRYVLLYAAVYLAGTFFSVDPGSSRNPGLLTVAFILFSLVFGSCLSNRNQLDAVITLMVLAAAAVSVYGILQYIFRWGYQSAAWVDSDMFSSIEFRVPSTMDNPNMLGQYLILAIPLGGAKLLSARERTSRLLYLGCCAVMCLCMILTFSRGAWLGLLFAGAVFFVMLDPRLLLLAPAALAVLWVVLPNTVLSRFLSIGNLGDASTSYRMFIWLGTIDMLRDYWLCGIGPGDKAFNLVYPDYSFSTIAAPHSHSLYLQLVCDAGIAALAVFLILIFVYFRMMGTAVSREKDRTSRLYQIACTCGVLGFLVQAMTDYSFYNYRVLFLFWAYLSLGAMTTRRSGLPEGRLLA
ncbi:MAG: hypothetical protein HFF52_04190 [Lawsonibacter sp.]|nr:hypothetical protein [Lawsonibacter sp.]